MRSRVPSPAFPRLFATAVLLLPLLLAGGRRQGSAQVSPTPTPTATPTPTPEIVMAVPATQRLYPIPNGSRYDGSNVVSSSDGALWFASAPDNSVVRLSPDGAKATRWAMPADAAPSSLLPNPDGTFWMTELGGFNISLFSPADSSLTRWVDTSRRPTALLRRPDGKLWLPETSGHLALFDPAASQITYFSSTSNYSLAYPWLDEDGTLWACDFVNAPPLYLPAIVRFSADGTSATRWAIDLYGSQPSKILRTPDGTLWISFWGAGLIGRFNPETALFEAFDAGTGSFPYTLLPYKGQVLFSEHGSGYIGFLDAAVRTPIATQTLARTDLVTTTTVTATASFRSDAPSADLDVTGVGTAPISGTAVPGLGLFPVGVGPVWGVAIDEARGRIRYATVGYVGTLSPPSADGGVELVPAAASIGGALGASWKTQVNLWNRGVPDSTGKRNPLDVTIRLLPTGWIAGFAPGAAVTVPPGGVASFPDPIGDLMSVKSSGAFRFTASPDQSQLYGWARTSVTRADGGTYGFAWNSQRAAGLGVRAGSSAFLFAPPLVQNVRTNAGFLVVDDAVLSVSAVDAGGTKLAEKTFDLPSGYHWQGSTIFAALGIPPSPSARIVFSVTSGTVLPFGNAIDGATNDPLLLAPLSPARAVTLQWLLGAARAAGPAGPTATTDVQLFNPGTASANVSLAFREAVPAGSAQRPRPPVSVVVPVPAGQVVSLPDVLGKTLGIGSGLGQVDVASDVPVNAFASVTGSPVSGSRVGFGIAAVNGGDGIGPSTAGDFIAAEDSGWDAAASDLHLTNPLDVEQVVLVSATTAEGVPSGSRSITLGPKETRFLESAWYSITGFGTSSGRLTVTLSSGAGPFFATLLRTDRKTLDVDALLPIVTPVTK